MAAIFNLLFLAAIVVLVHGQAKNQACDKSHLCLHGGSCEKRVIGGSGESIQVCNCAKAVDEDGNKYVGIHCEHQVPKADSFEGMKDDPRLCDNNGGFCLHDGICKDVDDEDPDICTCTDEFSGAHCEIAKSHKTIQKLSKGSGKCDMMCQNGSKCQFGFDGDSAKEVVFSGGETADVGKYFYQHCKCKNGFFGTNCESKHEICGIGMRSSEHYCHHSGTCVDMFSVGSDFMGSVQTSGERYMCDCSAGNEFFTNIAFAGKYCEVQSTSICSDRKNDFNGKQFCTNYGTCLSNRRGIFSCTCPNGYTGDHCEFTPDEEPPISEEKRCTKTICQNGGICQFGMKDHGLLSEMMAKPGMAESLGHLIPDNANENYEHCICPDGYAGTLCEHQAEICPHGKHICFHGSKCVKDEDEDWGYSCSCNDGKNFSYDDDGVYGGGGMQNLGIIDDDGLGDDEVDEVDENLFSDYYQGGGSDGKKNIDDDEDRRSLTVKVFEGQEDLGGTHCQFKATSKCDNGQSCFNGGACYQNRCICHDGFTGPFCEYTNYAVLGAPKKDTRTMRNSSKERHHSTIVLFSSSLAFLGVAFVLLVVAFTRIRAETRNNEEVAQRQIMEALSPSRTEKDAASMYLPFATMAKNIPSIGAKDLKTNDSGSTHSDGISPAEEKTVAELI